MIEWARRVPRRMGGSPSTVVAAVAYLGLTAVLTWPFVRVLGTHTVGHGTDMDLTVWTIAWDVHAFTHAPWRIFDANIFFPFHNTLAYSENLIGAALLAAPVVWLTGDALLGTNVAVLASLTVGAFGAYLLTSGHGAAMLTLAVGMLLVWTFTGAEPVDLPRRIRDLGWIGGLALVPAAIVCLPYRRRAPPRPSARRRARGSGA
jgi:hypothetical protein